MIKNNREQKRYEVISGFVDLDIVKKQMYTFIINREPPGRERDEELNIYDLLRFDRKFKQAGYDEPTKINIIEALF